jgi:uncharacterized membrane protein
MVKKSIFKKDKIIYHPIFKSTKTMGQKASDKLTEVAGSWAFIISFLFFLLIWMFINGYLIIVHYNNKPWDPYPFILLNLILSCLAAIQAPIILMSQNRQTQRDRLKANYDYALNRKAEKEIREIKKILLSNYHKNSGK